MNSTGGRVLAADAGDLTTYYLYGLGPIGELTTTWAYSLPDGSNTPRQLVNGDSEVTLTSSYTPWGDTLSTSGTGNFTYGYFGGIMDTATGLLYVGNGQYYDPATGRFLTRDAKPNQNNPYTPVDPTSALFAPLALLVMVFGRKKTRGKWDNLVILLVLGVSVGMGLTACNYTVTQTPNPENPAEPTVVVTVTDSNGENITIELTKTPTPTETLNPPDCSQYLYNIRIPSDRLVAARIFYEGASTYFKGSNSTNAEAETIPQNLFVKMVYAVKSLYERQGNGVGYAEFTRYDPGGRQLLSIADPNGNHSELKDDASFSGSRLDRALPDWAVINTNAILSDTPCPFAPINPFPADAMSDGIHWLSPTAFPRWDVATEKHMLPMADVVGCDGGCQHNDIRQLKHMQDSAGTLLGYAKEEFTPFVWEYSKNILKAPQDIHGDTECYWRGVYFISDKDFHRAVFEPDPQNAPIAQDYADGKFLCP